MKAAWIVLALLGMLVVAGCGKKGPPSPPGPPSEVIYPRFYPTH
jgi:predicted small lipoprotein YifL